MGFKMGIVGLPNVGKSTLFNALTKTAAAQAANFPFCTIEPNVGEVGVREGRRDHRPVVLRDAVEVAQVQEQVGEALGDRAGPEHLGQGRVASALEGQAVDHPDREGRNLRHELPERLGR